MFQRPRSSHCIFACFTLLACLLASPVVHADTPVQDPPGSDVSISLDEAHHVWIVPNIEPTRLTMNFGGASVNPGPDSASGVQIGVRLIASSNRTRSLLVGLDLRQLLAQTDGFSGINTLGTKLGIRLEWRPLIRFSPGIGAAWFFGDTLVAHDHDLQFNGNTAAIFTGMNVGPVRMFLEAAFGSYNEGPGFILLVRPAGYQTMNYSSYSFGVEFPIDVVWPDWLTMRPPGPSPVTPY